MSMGSMLIFLPGVIHDKIHILRVTVVSFVYLPDLTIPDVGKISFQGVSVWVFP